MPVCYDSLPLNRLKFTIFSTFAGMTKFHILDILAVILLLLSGCNQTYLNSPAKNLSESDARTRYMNLRNTWIEADRQQNSYANQRLSPSETTLDLKLKHLQREMIRKYKDAHFFPTCKQFL